jgi:hypothetical protein
MLWSWEQTYIAPLAAAQAAQRKAQHRAAQREAARDAKVAEGFLWLWAHDARRLLEDLDRQATRRRPRRQPFTLHEVRDAITRARLYNAGATLPALDRRQAGRQRAVEIAAGLWHGAWPVSDET